MKKFQNYIKSISRFNQKLYKSSLTFGSSRPLGLVYSQQLEFQFQGQTYTHQKCSSGGKNQVVSPSGTPEKWQKCDFFSVFLKLEGQNQKKITMQNSLRIQYNGTRNS